MSKHIDFLGRRYKRTYVVITDIDGLIVSGIFKNYDKAVGHVMNCLWEFSESYKDEGDIFEIGEMQYDENNDNITVKFKDATWKEPCEETYWIIPYDKYKKKRDAPKLLLKEVTAMNDIIDTIGLPAVLEQLAEECAELAQASLKYARLLRGDNPTPKTEQECLEALTEEMADVELCNSLLMTADHVDFDAIMELIEVKDKRWHERIQEAHHEEQ